MAPISDQIANVDTGMSRQNVEHYMLRFKDQMKVAAEGQKRTPFGQHPDVSK